MGYTIEIKKDIKKKERNFITQDGKKYNSAEEYFGSRPDVGTVGRTKEFPKS